MSGQAIASLIIVNNQIGVIPIGFRLATFEFVKLPTGKAFRIKNLKSKIQNGIVQSPGLRILGNGQEL
jgi:hypothetical protein